MPTIQCEALANPVSVLRRQAVIKWLDRCTGAVFLLFAARLAFGKR